MYHTQVREAARGLLLAELKRIGPEGRQRVILKWSPFMPDLKDNTSGSISMAEPVQEVPCASALDEGDSFCLAVFFKLYFSVKFVMKVTLVTDSAV